MKTSHFRLKLALLFSALSFGCLLIIGRPSILNLSGALAGGEALVFAQSETTTSQTQPLPVVPGCWDLMQVYSHPSQPPIPGGFVSLPGIVALSDDDVWAVGFAGAEESTRALTMQWDGEHWNTVPNPVGEGTPTRTLLYAVTALTPDDIWAVGAYYGPGDARATTLTMHWDGSAWQVVPSPNVAGTPNILQAVSGSGPGDVWAVGYTGSTNYLALILHWDGKQWSHVDSTLARPTERATPTPPPGGYQEYDPLYGVKAFAPDNAWAAGNGGTSGALVVHWDGVRWSEASVPFISGGGWLLGLTGLTPSDIWAVGGQAIGEGSSQVVQPLVLHWDGSAWSEVLAPVEGAGEARLQAVTTYSADDVWGFGYYVEGNNHQAEGSANPYLALVMHWDGQSWTAVSDPVGGTYSELLGASVSGNYVWAVGTRGGSNSGDAGVAIRRPLSSCDHPAQAPSPTQTAAPSFLLRPSQPPVALPGEGSMTFPQTGKTVRGIFLDYWNSHGGLAQIGYPISDLIGEISPLDGVTYSVQYFERAVLEYHPENQPPYNILLSQLGTLAYKDKYPAGAPGQQANNDPGSLYFAQTNHRLGGRFLDYWRANGGVMQQGYPISDEFTEISPLDGKAYRVQYFERAVFEYHPENPPRYDVLLSQLGTFRYDALYGAKAPTGQSALTPRRIGADASAILPAGSYLFWADMGLASHPFYEYNLSTGATIRVPGVSSYDAASDGTTLVWTESTTGTTALLGYDIASGRSFPITPTNAIQPGGYVDYQGLGMSGGVLFYNHSTEGGVSLYSLDLSTKQERLLVHRQYGDFANVEIGKAVAAGKVVVWSEVEDLAGTSSLHMLKMDGSVGDTIIATAKGNYGFSGYATDADHVVYSFNSSDGNVVHLYDIATRVTKDLSIVPGYGAVIGGGKVAWFEYGSVRTGHRSDPSEDRIVVYDITTGDEVSLTVGQDNATPWAIYDGKQLVYTRDAAASTGGYMQDLLVVDLSH